MIDGKVRLPDDSLEFIRDEHDLLDLIRTRLGHEVAEMVAVIAAKVTREAHAVGNDLRSYETQLDAQHNTLVDLRNELQLLNSLHQQERIDRRKIYAAIQRMQGLISNHV